MSDRITVNGEAVPLEAETVAGLLAARGLGEGKGVAVALNGALVPRADWNETPLRPGDRLEVVKAVGGG